MKSLDDMLNWRLKKGSHEWPGPDGGTCINEAAVVVAGFPYRAIKSVDDCPPCFSRSLAEYMLVLNDGLVDEHRQHLIRFVARLAGTAATREIEAHRDKVILQATLAVLGPALWGGKPISLRPPCAQYERSTLYGRHPNRNVQRQRLARMLVTATLRGARYAGQVTAAAVNRGFVPMSACIAIAEAAFAVGPQSGHLERLRATQRAPALRPMS